MDIEVLLQLEEKAQFLDALKLINQQIGILPHEKRLIKSRLFYQVGDREQANIELTMLLDDLQNINSEELKIDILVLKIEYLLDINEIQGIENYFTLILEIESSSTRGRYLKNQKVWAKFLYQMGNFHTLKVSYADAQEAYLNSLKVFKELQDDRFESLVNLKIGTIHLIKSDFKNAVNYFKKAIQINKKVPNLFDKADMLNRLGIAYLKMSEFGKAETCLRESIFYYESNFYLYGLQKAYINLGTVFRGKGDYQNAIIQLKKGSEIANQLNDTEIIFGINVNIGTIYLDNGELDVAFTWMAKSLDLVKLIKNKGNIAILYSSLALIYQKKGLFVASLKNYEASMKLHKELQNERGIVKVYHNIGLIIRLQGNPMKALPYFEYSLKLRKKMHDLEGIAWDLQYIGMIKFELTDYDEARKIFEECYEIRRKIANKIHLSEILFLTISVYVILGLDNLVRTKFHELSKIHNTVNSSIVQNHYLLSKIKVEQSNRIGNKVKENEVYEQILRQDVIDIEHTQEAEIGHCNFLLLEYKSNRDETTLTDLRPIIVDLYDKVRKQENHQLLVEILILEAKLALIQQNFTMSYKFIGYASDIAENKNLIKLKFDISIVEENLKEDIIKMAKISQNKISDEGIVNPSIDDYIEMLTENIDYDYDSAILFPSDEKELIEANLKFAELIVRETTLPPDTKETLHFLELSLWDYRLLTTTYNFIRRLENNAYYNHPQTFDILELLEDRLQIFKQKQYTRKINIIDDQSSDRLVLQLDKNLIVVIFDNLLQNAMKFTPEGGIVEIKFINIDNDIVIEFSNDCRRIPDWVIPTLMQRFRQWYFDDQTRKLGIGIGLEFVHKAVKYLGGKIELISPYDSEEGGIMVRISLPVSLI